MAGESYIAALDELGLSGLTSVDGPPGVFRYTGQFRFDGDGEKRPVLVTLAPGDTWDELHRTRLARTAELSGMTADVVVGTGPNFSYAITGQPNGRPLAARAGTYPRMTWRQVADAVEQASRATYAGHLAGLRHGRINPNEIWLDESVDPAAVQLSGMGLAPRRVDPSEVTTFTAPEVAGGQFITERADVFSLGRVLQEMLERSDGDAPEDLKRLANQATATDPLERTVSARELASRIRDIADSTTPQADGSNAASTGALAAGGAAAAAAAARRARGSSAETDADSQPEITPSEPVAGAPQDAPQPAADDSSIDLRDPDPAAAAASAGATPAETDAPADSSVAAGVGAAGGVAAGRVAAGGGPGDKTGDQNGGDKTGDQKTGDDSSSARSAGLAAAGGAAGMAAGAAALHRSRSSEPRKPVEPESAAATGDQRRTGGAPDRPGQTDSASKRPASPRAASGGDAVSRDRSAGTQASPAASTPETPDVPEAPDTSTPDPAKPAGVFAQPRRSAQPAPVEPKRGPWWAVPLAILLAVALAAGTIWAFLQNGDNNDEATTEQTSTADDADATADDADTTTTADDTTTTADDTTTTADEADTTTTVDDADATTTTEAPSTTEPPADFEQAPLAAGVIPADEAGLEIVHGIPNVPVDLYADGQLLVGGFAPGNVAGPLPMPDGTSIVAAFPSIDGPPVSEADRTDASLLTRTTDLGDDPTSVVAHLDSEGNPALSAFVDNLSPLSPGMSRVVVRHTAALGDIDVALGDTEPRVLGPNTFFTTEQGAGKVTVSVNGANFGPIDAAAGELVVANIVGSDADGSLDVIVQRFGGLGAAPDGVPTGNSGLAATQSALSWLTAAAALAMALMLGVGGAMRRQNNTP